MDYLPFYSLAPQHDLIRSELNNCFRKLMDWGNFILGDEVAGFEAKGGPYDAWPIRPDLVEAN